MYKRKGGKEKIFALSCSLSNCFPLLHSVKDSIKKKKKKDLPNSLLDSFPPNAFVLNFDRNWFVIVEGKDENDKTLISCKL